MIKVHNDGKGKHQSFEASAEFNVADSYYHANTTITGYGATEQEAIDNMKSAAKTMTDGIHYKLTTFPAVTYVDYKGDPIK